MCLCPAWILLLDSSISATQTTVAYLFLKVIGNEGKAQNRWSLSLTQSQTHFRSYLGIVQTVKCFIFFILNIENLKIELSCQKLALAGGPVD